MNIWLRYTRDGSTYSKRFDAVESVETPVIKRSQLETLRDTEVDHVLARKRHWSLLIGLNETTVPANADWMDEFIAGDARYICFNPQASPTPPDNEFIEVVTDGGASPRQYHDDILALPYYPITLREKRRQ